MTLIEEAFFLKARFIILFWNRLFLQITANKINKGNTFLSERTVSKYKTRGYFLNSQSTKLLTDAVIFSKRTVQMIKRTQFFHLAVYTIIQQALFSQSV